MATLREVFVDWKIKSNLASEMKKLDDAIDDTSDEFKKLADDAEKAAKKTADEWGKVGAKTRDIGKSIATGIGVGVTALTGAATAVAAFVVQWSQGAAQIDSTAKRVGISAKSLQEWEYAAKASGGEAEGIAGIFKELNNRLAEVGETGTGSAADALTLLKLRVQDLRQLKPEQQMEAIADRLSMISDVGARTFIKDSLFGGEYEKIGSLLEQGSAGIAGLRKEANALGGVLDGAALKGAKDFNRELIKTDAIIDGVKSTIVTALLPAFSGVVRRTGEWVSRNRELISSKVEVWAERLARWLEKAVPLVGDVVDTVGRLTDTVGGLDNAVKLAAGGWAAYQVAALAALGPVGAAIAVITTGITAAIALAEKYGGDPGKLARTKGALAASEEELRLQNRALDETAKDRTYDPGIDDARIAFRKTVAAASIESKGASPELRRSIIRQMQNAEAALDAAYAADAAHAAEVEANSAAGMSLGKIAKPGERPLTTEALLKEQRKREAELEKLRKIRADLEARRARTGSDNPDIDMVGGVLSKGGRERLTIERTLDEVNKRLNGTGVKSINELMAEAVGQGTGFGGGGLRPAGLGTSINQIDASITINVGGVEVDMPAGVVNASDPRGSGQSFGQEIGAVLSRIFGQAAQLQRAQING